MDIKKLKRIEHYIHRELDFADRDAFHYVLNVLDIFNDFNILTDDGKKLLKEMKKEVRK